MIADSARACFSNPPMYHSAIWLRPAYMSPANSGDLSVPQALVRVHAAAVVAEQRLGHERHALAVLIRHVADDVFVEHHVVGGFDQGVEALIDFALPGGGDFVMVALDIEAAP